MQKIFNRFVRTMKILIPTSVIPSKKNLRTIYINNIVKFLKKQTNLEILWIVYQPEIIKPSKNNENVVFDIHEFKNSIEMLKKTKPDYVMVTNSLDPIQYSLSLACKHLQIPLVCFYYNHPITGNTSLTKDTSMSLHNFFSNQLPTDSIDQQKRMRRGNFFIYKYLFLLKTKKSMNISFLNIFRSVFKEIFMYLTNRNLSSNTLPDFHFLPNTQMIDELTKLNIKKNRLFVTGNPIWDNLYENSTKIINQKSETNKINLLHY